jgi:hypothetical protein
MTMQLEIIIPTQNPGIALVETAASLIAQTDCEFAVLISDNHSTTGLEHIETAHKTFAEVGIELRLLKPGRKLLPIEHWNWAHAQARGEWIKPLFAGERLKPLFVEHLKKRISEKPDARVFRCDLELQTEWGPEKRLAPFQASSITRAEFTNYFPSHLEWLTHSANFAYERTAWLTMGGYAKHLPASAALNMNVMLALHHGLENLAETLVEIASPHGSSVNKECSKHSCHLMELWLILLQARNYCLSAKLSWTERFLFLRSVMASLRRW